MSICAVVLAASDEAKEQKDNTRLTRMLAGKPQINWVRDSLAGAGAEDQLYLISPHQEDVRQAVGERAAFALVEHPESWKEIFLAASNFIESRSGITIVMPGNLPLLRQDVILEALETFRERSYDCMILTAVTDQSNGWERIVRDPRGIFLGSLPEDDLPPAAHSSREVNGRVYFFNTARLLSGIGKLGQNGRIPQIRDTAQLVDIMMQEGRAVGTLNVPPEVILPIESLVSGNMANHILNSWIVRKHIEEGVEFIDPEQTFIESAVRIGRGTVIWPGCVLTGDTVIGENCIVHANSVIENAQIGSRSIIRQANIRNSHVGERCQIGAFAVLHDGAWLERDVRVGPGSDISNTIIGHGAVIDSHVLIEDADIGDGARLGAGSMTVNEDGSGRSYRTTIGSLAMIGANSSLVAPVEIEANSYIAAGSVITSSVPAFALALGRSRQTNIDDWVRRSQGKQEPI